MEPGMLMMWALVFGALYYEQRIGIIALLFVLGALSGAIPLNLSWV